MFAVDVLIFLWKSQLSWIWIDGISEKKLGNLLKLTECAFLMGLGESSWTEPARPNS